METPKTSRWKRLSDFLRKKYRLVILSDSTFGEKISIRLTPWNIIIGVSAVTILLTGTVISLIAFTSLREYIPGYGNIAERKQILELNLLADSLESAIETKETYLNSLLNALNERLETQSPRPKKDTMGKYNLRDASPGVSDIEFRKEYEKNKDNIGASVAKLKYKGMSEVVFFTPVKGIITSSFNLKDTHYGTDIVTKADETIKSTLEGTIVFTGFSAQDGNVIQVQHNNNILSIYKHCSTLLKKTGEHVKAGDGIGIVGNSGEKSNGPHLHFELWYNGAAVDPQEFVAF